MVFVGFKKPWSFHFWPTNLLAAFSAHSRLLWPYPLHHPGIVYYIYRNKSKSQFTSPTPAQLPAVAVSSGHIVCV
jgi:hypothetical protein